MPDAPEKPNVDAVTAEFLERIVEALGEKDYLDAPATLSREAGFGWVKGWNACRAQIAAGARMAKEAAGDA